MDSRNGVIASTVYADNVLVARDVAVNLPAVNFQTADVQAMGTMSTVLVGLLEDMEASFHKIGIDSDLARSCSPEPHHFEARWVQNVLKADGTAGPEGCKAFLTGTPTGIPALAPEPGNPTEVDVTIKTTRYQLFVGGEEICCIDRLSQILRIRGKDYWGQIANLL